MIRPALYVAALFAVLGAGYSLFGLYETKWELEAENSTLKLQLKVAERNAAIAEELLETELEIRNTARQALTQLHEVVPDVEYDTPLPAGIQSVLDDFHLRNGL